jgi:ubiquinone/menaquinone biosynthesis C-methylase UbiE
MNFGYIPDKRRKANSVMKIFGWLYLTRRMQAPVVIKMLDLHKEHIFLDLGCGGGNFAYEMSKRCKSVGIDINPNIKNLAFAQRHQANLNFMMADGLNLPLKDQSIDKVLLGGTLQPGKQNAELMQIKNEKLIKECWRTLRENGTLVLSVVQERSAIRTMYKSNGFFIRKLIKLFNLPPNYAAFEKDYTDWIKIPKFYTVKELTKLLRENGFIVIEVEFAPKEIGSKILDIFLMLSRCLKIPQPNHPIYFPFLYPLIYFADKLSKGKLKGNEFIMKAKKEKENYAEK